MAVAGQVEGYYLAVGRQLVEDGTPGTAASADAMNKQQRFAGAVSGVV
jgi:hypothetical protein